MQTLISKSPNFNFPLLPNSPISPFPKPQNILRFHPQTPNFTFKTRNSCSTTYTNSPSFNGWDATDSDSVNPTESTQFPNFLGDKKYVFVYLFGFVCALAISRVKVSSIIVYPACAVVFAIGFSVGLVKGGDFKLTGSNRRSVVDETVRGSIDKLRGLKEELVECKVNVVKLRDGVRGNVECGSVSVRELEGYGDVIESVYRCLENAADVFEKIVSVDSKDKEGGLNKETSRGKKKSLTGEQKQENVLDASAKERNLNTEVSDKFEDDDNSEFAEHLSDGTGMKYKRNSVEENNDMETFFDQKVYGYQNKTLRSSNNRRVYSKDETEEMASHESSSYDSVDFSLSMKQTKSAASYGRQRKREMVDRNYSMYTEEDQREARKYSFQKDIFNPLEQPFLNKEELGLESNIFGSSRIGGDLEFENYLGEATNLLTEAKGFLKKKGDDSSVEKALNKSAILFSKAIEMRPMSLLAVGQLGNTYLLHGELKLRVSREMRSLLSRSERYSGGGDWERVLHKYDDQFSNKGQIKSALGEVCEECEDLLIKAGRKYKLALSIDGDDMRALYNWGLALDFRGQLISDIGPSAARDADKVFLAAIDKFDAMLSKSNVYAPDALYRWGAALQQRSRLRPRNSREKVKLLQQARCLYEDAIQMDSRNPQLQKALSSCVSELEYWYR